MYNNLVTLQPSLGKLHTFMHDSMYISKDKPHRAVVITCINRIIQGETRDKTSNKNIYQKWQHFSPTIHVQGIPKTQPAGQSN